MNKVKTLFWRMSFITWLVAIIGCNNTIEPLSTIELNQTAIFEKHVENGIDILSLDLDNGEFENLATIPLQERYLLSPNGKYIVTYFGKNLKIIDLIAQEQAILLEQVVLPTAFIENISHNFVSWSPNSLYLAVLTEGPSLFDPTLFETKLLVFDMQTMSIVSSYSNETWINEVEWSSDSSSIAFPEISIPCNYTGECLEVKPSTLHLTIISKTGLTEWEKIATKLLKPPTLGSSWRSLSICNLNWSSSDIFISYQHDCELGTLSTNINVYLTESRLSEQTIQILPTQFTDTRNIYLNWLPSDRAILFLSESVIDQHINLTNSINLYEITNSTPVLLSKNHLNVDFSMPIITEFAEYKSSYYGLSPLTNDEVLLFALDSMNFITATKNIPQMSMQGLWVANNYLTQSQNKIILIDFTDNSLEVIKDDIPEDLSLLGWYIQP